MQINVKGRRAPAPYVKNTSAVMAGIYLSTAPRETPVFDPNDRPLTRDEYRQAQEVFSLINALPHSLSVHFTNRYLTKKNELGQVGGLRFLTRTFKERTWPRLEKVNVRHGMNVKVSERFLSERDEYSRLPKLKSKELEKLAGRIAAALFSAYEELADAYADEHEGDKNEVLFTPRAQSYLYERVAGAARAFNITPLHWKKHRKGKLTIANAYSAIARLISDEWWLRQLKAQRTRWNEALFIAAGLVNKTYSPYASRQAVREVQAQRQANLEYLKQCDLENVETGERIDLIEKVLKSISNPEIRRMELMNTIAGIERYAASVGDIGMFITLTTPSKYHPTRVVGKDKTVQLNHKWNDEAYSPKDGQRYLCNIWSKMRTAFKDKDLNVYGLRVVEPHHDGTPHWHMMLFCDRSQRKEVVEIMRRYAMKEDGNERGAAKNRFDCKHLIKGRAAGYVAKYIAKNIDGYALAGEVDHDTGRTLTETAAAVNAWASTWRIPQFKPIGVPTMGAYRELRKLPRGVSVANEFDERVEAARAAADAGDFDLYIAAQGGANVPRDTQTVRVARKTAEELNAYDEEVQKVVGVFAPHLGADRIRVTRTEEWRIVAKAVDVDLNLLTLKGGSSAPRSPVNNCGSGGFNADTELTPTPSEHAAAVLNLVDDGVVAWDDPEVVTVLRCALKHDAAKPIRQQRSGEALKQHQIAPSARLTRCERKRMPYIKAKLAISGVYLGGFELKALARGAIFNVDGKTFSFGVLKDWEGWSEFDS